MTLSFEAVASAYPHLYTLVGGYFHQDWPQEYGNSPQAALDDYMECGAPAVAATADEIDRLLATSDDERAEQILDRLDNAYNYAFDGYTATTWLEAVRDRLRRGTGAPA